MEEINSEDQFNEVIQSEKPIIIKFFADWCPDCKRLDMFINGVIEEFNNYDWYEINSDQVKGIAEKHEVMGIPSLLVFQNGEKKAHLHSAYTKTPESITEFLHQQLG
ncbi:thioredoxin family protein [Virgibacillus alimentarius]|uniref:Thiol-disulfide isomerase/thioredoxin n=1 Tax=Virgibacillus alimentarius TaxID=698769 RepID=A0ABS4S9W0_9BACI|nr:MULTISPECIES: thioredoxin family protein [Virgibacillus]MBP2258293.1 thiol-disulfide isomerase/thioredoxin [Virgibacillus alimentarius]HLR67329.1 thioredoxin family protein [Virgibacillus sp.]